MRTLLARPNHNRKIENLEIWKILKSGKSGETLDEQGHFYEGFWRGWLMVKNKEFENLKIGKVIKPTMWNLKT